MLQYILTFLIIGFALFMAVKPLFRKKKKLPGDCEGCSSGCSGCPVMEIKSRLESERNSA